MLHEEGKGSVTVSRRQAGKTPSDGEPWRPPWWPLGVLLILVAFMVLLLAWLTR
jgi:hypothetical protein